MTSLATLATVMLVSRVWSPGKNTIVVLEVKHSSACYEYSESVVQLAELWGQAEHEVAVGVSRILSRTVCKSFNEYSAATMAVNVVD